MTSRRRTTMSERSPARPRRRRRRLVTLRRLIFSVLLVFLAAEAALALLKLPVFEISDVRVYGNRVLPAAFVADCTKVPEKSNILLFKTDTIVRRLRASPIVEKVTVSRRVPDILIVRITERRAYLVLQTPEGAYEVDAGGIPFRKVARPDPKLPVVSCEAPCPIVPGKPVVIPAFKTAVNCLQLARRQGDMRVRKITVDRNNDLCLNVGDGLLIKLGQPRQIEDKLEKAGQTIKLVPNLEYVDVTCPEAPALKLRSSGSAPS